MFTTHESMKNYLENKHAEFTFDVSLLCVANWSRLKLNFEICYNAENIKCLSLSLSSPPPPPPQLVAGTNITKKLLPGPKKVNTIIFHWSSITDL